MVNETLKDIPDLMQFGEIGKVVMAMRDEICDLRSKLSEFKDNVNQQPQFKEWYSINEVAGLLGLSVRTVHRLVKSKSLKRSYGTWKVMIPRESIEEYRKSTVLYEQPKNRNFKAMI